MIAKRLSSLLSFAKFLELLVYSSALCKLVPELCEHTTPPSQPWKGEDAPLPRSRFNIIRCFGLCNGTVSFTLSSAHDVFDLRVPRLQFTKAGIPDRATKLRIEPPSPEAEDEKRILRREIKTWWQGVSNHLDELVRYA
jgi:1-phosphatidylinositol-3-phosphate 5-kinase